MASGDMLREMIWGPGGDGMSGCGLERGGPAKDRGGIYQESVITPELAENSQERIDDVEDG